MDINEKLRSLTPEQAKAVGKGLGAHLNSCFPDKKKPTTTKKKPSTTKKGKK